MEKITVAETIYEICPVPPSLSLVSSKIGQLLKTKPENMDEAIKTGEQIKKGLEALLKVCCNPFPKEQHQNEVYMAIINHTKQVMEDAGFLQPAKTPPSEN